ncbi:MAG: VWA domain-containing protein, partial [Rubrivivax sp.]|nr:VWA domain-containing protein [Rubrivivax sp.]
MNAIAAPAAMSVPGTIVPAPLQSIAGFAALLRDPGFVVGIDEQRDFVQAAVAVPVERAARLETAWRAIACRDARDWRRWPELFERYWHPQRLKGSVRTSGATRPARDLRQVVQALHEQLGEAPPRREPGARAMDTALADDAAAGADDAGAPRAQGGASRTEALHDRGLSEWLPQDLAQLDRLAAAIARRLRHRVTRRWRDDAEGRRLDVRRTLRASLRTGGLPLAPAWRERRREPPRLFVLVDVSRSMETHAQLFLRIARAFVGAADARVFVFHTRLAEV